MGAPAYCSAAFGRQEVRCLPSCPDPLAGSHHHVSPAVCDRYLSDTAEQSLLAWIYLTWQMGQPAEGHAIRKMAIAMMKEDGHQPHGELHHWWELFQHRHADLFHMLRVQSRSRAQAGALDPDVVQDFYDKLAWLVKRYNLTPARIYNLDETGFAKLGNKAKVAVPKEERRAHALVHECKEHMTCLATIRADGMQMPMLAIFKGHYNGRPRIYRLHGAPEDTRVCYTRERHWISPGSSAFSLFSAKSSITAATFEAYLILLQSASNCTPENPILLLLDNHSSRFDAHMRLRALNFGIIMLSFPANGTWAFQPLDALIFGVLKNLSHRAVDSARLSGHDVTGANRLSFLAEPWARATSPENIMAAFRVRGIWPVDMKANEALCSPQGRPLLQLSASSSSSAPTGSSSAGAAAPSDSRLSNGQYHLSNVLPIDPKYSRVLVVQPPAEGKQQKRVDKGYGLIITAQQDWNRIFKGTNVLPDAPTLTPAEAGSSSSSTSRKRKLAATDPAAPADGKAPSAASQDTESAQKRSRTSQGPMPRVAKDVSADPFANLKTWLKLHHGVSPLACSCYLHASHGAVCYLCPGKFVIIPLGENSDSGQRFGVARVEDATINYAAVKVRWFDAAHEFGDYSEANMADGRPWVQYISATCMATAFEALQNGRIPRDVTDWLNKHMEELAELPYDD